MSARTRGECRVMKLMKQKQRGKITLSFNLQKEKYLFCIYDVITLGKKHTLDSTTHTHAQV